MRHYGTGLLHGGNARQKTAPAGRLMRAEERRGLSRAGNLSGVHDTGVTGVRTLSATEFMPLDQVKLPVCILAREAETLHHQGPWQNRCQNGLQ